MRFLVTAKSKHQIPPEAMGGLTDAMIAWINKYTANGKMEQVWGLAGLPGGGSILNVDSLEELDTIMGEFPFGPFSDTEISAIVDLVPALQRGREAFEAMMAGGS